MADEISDEARALIDAAVAEGRVTKVPAGKSAFEYVYDEERGRVVHVQTANGEPVKFTTNWGFAKGSVAPHVLKRRARVRELHAEGKTTKEIGHLTDVSYQTAAEDQKALGLPIHPEKRGSPRRDILMALHAQGLSDPAIAKAMGAHRKTVATARQKLGLLANRRK